MDDALDALLALLRKALWDETWPAACFASADKGLWKRIFALALRHGVKGLAYEALDALAPQERPDKELRILWAVHVDALEKRYGHLLAVTGELGDLFYRHGIKMLVFKGLSLSAYYPVPSHREFGDLDIYLFGDYEKGNSLIREQGLRVDTRYSKHAIFRYRKVWVENHRYFLDRAYRVNRRMEEAIQQALVQEPCPLLFEDARVYAPNPACNILFLACHTLNHLQSALVLRHLVDWSLFLKNNADSAAWEAGLDKLRQQGLLPLVAVITQLCRDHLGLPEPYALPLRTFKPDPQICHFVWEHIVHPRYGRLTEKLHPAALMVYKTRRLFYHHKLHRMVYGEPFLFALLRRFRRFMAHPSGIFKNR